MYHDPEIKAMNDTYEAIKDLDESARNRVIQWLISKFSANNSVINFKGSDQSEQVKNTSNSTVDISSYETAADFFSQINSKTEVEKVLALAAYLQEKHQKQELTGREINRELTHLGHGVKNITANITLLMNKKPNLMIQIRKEGKSRQAQKKYKVTNEGIKAVKQMINQNGEIE